MMLVHIPPLGEVQIRPKRPFPAFCISAIIVVPSIDSEANFLAILLVESISE